MKNNAWQKSSQTRASEKIFVTAIWVCKRNEDTWKLKDGGRADSSRSEIRQDGEAL